MAKTQTDDEGLKAFRASQIKLIHVAKRSLGLDEDSYRTVLASTTGKESCAEMTLTELGQVVDRMRELGFKPSGGQKGKKYSPKSRHKAPHLKTQHDLARALWIELYKVGAVQNRYEGALDSFVRRMTGVEKLVWVRSTYQMNKILEGLKSMYERKTGEKPSPGEQPPSPPAPLPGGRGEPEGEQDGRS